MCLPAVGASAGIGGQSYTLWEVVRELLGMIDDVEEVRQVLQVRKMSECAGPGDGRLSSASVVIE